MKSIQLAWRPGTARFEATGRSGTGIAFEAPGEPAEILLTPDRAGTFTIICDHFCGAGHGGMKLTVTVP